MKSCKSNHVYYTYYDFTKEEIEENNKLARAVIVGRRKICKYCGFESKYKVKGTHENITD